MDKPILPTLLSVMLAVFPACSQMTSIKSTIAGNAPPVVVDLKSPPLAIFDAITAHESNYFSFRLSPEDVIAAGTRVKTPGEEMRGERLELVARSRLQREKSPYERLIGDAIRGDASLFTRDDCVEAAWRVVEPALDSAAVVEPYEPGSWGPASAAAIVQGSEGRDDPKHETPPPC